MTDYATLARAELPIATGRYATSRYSLLTLHPLTGRRHQIRRHLHHIHHPLIGDTTHGEGRHNRLFRERFGVSRLLLHACLLECRHPADGCRLRIAAPLPKDWVHLLTSTDWDEQAATGAAAASGS